MRDKAVDRGKGTYGKQKNAAKAAAAGVEAAKRNFQKMLESDAYKKQKKTGARGAKLKSREYGAGLY